MRRAIWVVLFLLGFSLSAWSVESLNSGDAFARYNSANKTWTCGTGLIEQRLELADGHFRLATLTNRLTGTEFIGGTASDEFRFRFGGVEYTGDSGGFRMKSYEIVKMPVPKASPGIEPGVTLVVNLEHPLFSISLHYDIFASTPRTQLGMIRKWYTITNRTKQTQQLTEIGMNRMRFKPEDSMRFTLYNWVGGGSGKSTNELQSQSFRGTKARTFFSMAGNPDFRADDIYDGSSSYHPYFVLEDQKAGEGVYFGFNYLGPWSARIWNPGDNEKGGFPINSQLEMHAEPLKPGATFEAPNSFVGVYKGDLDSACEQLQDWQATYKWDYTREQYLWKTCIVNGNWFDPIHRQNTDLHKKEMWRIAELCRRSGAEIAHEDDFWFDKRGRGVWEGIEWKELVDYLRQSDIIFRLWILPQHFAAGTPQDLEHPDWALDPKVPDGVTVWYGRGFCTASQGAHDYMRKFMLDREKRYGTFYWRLDGWVEAPCASTKHDHPAGQPFVKQYRHYLDMMREVKAANPDMGLQGCNSGGEWVNWDKLELVENQQGSDGGGPDDTYYLSYFWPVAKIMEGGAGSTSYTDDASLDDLRKNVLMQRYLRQEGVLDRYMRVYHPRAEGAPNPHTYLQITNSDRTKVMISQDVNPAGEVVVYPKALVPNAQYHVAFRLNKEMRVATGAELMQSGIRFRSTLPNEMILLNLDSAPGRGTDKTPPSAPEKVTKKTETWNGHTGVAVRWTPARDDVIVAEYKVLRDGKPIDRVAVGCFFFDPDARLDSKYEIAAVDGDGNRSSAIVAGE